MNLHEQLMRLVVYARENGLDQAEAWLQRKLTEYRERTASFSKRSYVEHVKGHKNSQGELAEWVIKSHETGKILSSHKSEDAAKKHLQDMHAHSGSYKTPFLRKGAWNDSGFAKVSAAGGHYIWEANGDEAIIISPDHKIKHLPFEEAKPFWAKLFELEEQIEDPEQLQLAIDDYCATFFPAEETPESDEAEEFWSNPNQFSFESADEQPKYPDDWFKPPKKNTWKMQVPGTRPGGKDRPKKIEEFEKTIGGPKRSSLLKTGGDLHNRVEKASAELAKLWEKVKPAMAKGYAIEHHLHLAQQNLQQGLGLIPAQPEVAAVYISQAEDTLRKANEEIAHLGI